jgi:hypothetical protein
MSDLELIETLRGAFIRLLTEDGLTTDRRRKDYNQAIFFPLSNPSFPGHAVFNGTSLDMVLEKFDRAAQIARGRR